VWSDRLTVLTCTFGPLYGMACGISLTYTVCRTEGLGGSQGRPVTGRTYVRRLRVYQHYPRLGEVTGGGVVPPALDGPQQGAGRDPHSVAVGSVCISRIAGGGET
jgi:hypothetical protein